MARTNINLPDNVDREMRHEAIDLGLRYPGEFVQHLWKKYKAAGGESRRAKGDKKMKKEVEIYNGEERDITVVTGYATIVIPAKDSETVFVGGDAQFNTGEFYVEEEGSWYAKTEHCYTGCDIEIYDADAE